MSRLEQFRRTSKKDFFHFFALWARCPPEQSAVGVQRVPRAPRDGFQPILCGPGPLLAVFRRKMGFFFKYLKTDPFKVK